MARHGICWTYHNYFEDDVLHVKGLVGTCGIKGLGFGREICKTTGTQHLQGYLQANHDIFSRFKKAFKKDIHLEKQRRGNWGSRVWQNG
jgi:hypothetical protein